MVEEKKEEKEENPSLIDEFRREAAAFQIVQARTKLTDEQRQRAWSLVDSISILEEMEKNKPEEPKKPEEKGKEAVEKRTVEEPGERITERE